MINSSVRTNAHVISAFSISCWGVSSCDPFMPTETQQLVADDSFFDLLPKLFPSSQGGLEAFSNGSTHVLRSCALLAQLDQPRGMDVPLCHVHAIQGTLGEIGDVAENLK